MSRLRASTRDKGSDKFRVPIPSTLVFVVDVGRLVGAGGGQWPATFRVIGLQFLRVRKKDVSRLERKH